MKMNGLEESELKLKIRGKFITLNRMLPDLEHTDLVFISEDINEIQKFIKNYNRLKKFFESKKIDFFVWMFDLAIVIDTKKDQNPPKPYLCFDIDEFEETITRIVNETEY